MNTYRVLKACLNWKVLAALGGAVLLLILFVPKFAAAAPLFLVLVCPLSMVFMMRGMRHGENAPRGGKENP